MARQALPRGSRAPARPRRARLSRVPGAPVRRLALPGTPSFSRERGPAAITGCIPTSPKPSAGVGRESPRVCPCPDPRHARSPAGSGPGPRTRGKRRRRARGERDTYWQAAAGEPPPGRRGETPGDTAALPPALRPPQRRPLPSSAAFMVLPSGRAPSCGAAAGLSLPLDGSRDGGAAAAGGAALGMHPAGRRSPAPRPGPLPAPRRLSRLPRAPPPAFTTR